jgi:hypothetical protein
MNHQPDHHEAPKVDLVNQPDDAEVVTTVLDVAAIVTTTAVAALTKLQPSHTASH